MHISNRGQPLQVIHHVPELRLLEILQSGQPERPMQRRGHFPGKRPLIDKVTVRMVIRNLSAMGSMTLPTTVCSLYLRAIHPSTKSVIPAYAKRALLKSFWANLRLPASAPSLSRRFRQRRFHGITWEMFLLLFSLNMSCTVLWNFRYTLFWVSYVPLSPSVLRCFFIVPKMPGTPLSFRNI